MFVTLSDGTVVNTKYIIDIECLDDGYRIYMREGRVRKICEREFEKLARLIDAGMLE